MALKLSPLKAAQFQSLAADISSGFAGGTSDFANRLQDISQATVQTRAAEQAQKKQNKAAKVRKRTAFAGKLLPITKPISDEIGRTKEAKITGVGDSSFSFGDVTFETAKNIMSLGAGGGAGAAGGTGATFGQAVGGAESGLGLPGPSGSAQGTIFSGGDQAGTTSPPQGGGFLSGLLGGGEGKEGIKSILGNFGKEGSLKSPDHTKDKATGDLTPEEIRRLLGQLDTTNFANRPIFGAQ